LPYPDLTLDDSLRRRLEIVCRGLPPRRERTGPAPEHETLISQHLETNWERTWRFASIEAVHGWNAGWDQVLLDPTRSHPALLAPADVIAAIPGLDVVARIASQLVHEEIRAGTPPPEVGLGEHFELGIWHHYEVRPFPRRQEELLVRLSWSVVDTVGGRAWSVECTREYDLKRLPSNLPGLLLTASRCDVVDATGPGDIGIQG
jgi:hypothetical protein